MQPVKLTIPGKYWDSQIYSGRLYLFGLSGDIITLHWDHLSDALKVDKNLRLAVISAFQRSDLLYDPMYELLFQDIDIKNILLKKFSRLSSMNLLVSEKNMKSLMLGHQDNRFPFPHTDSQIYQRNLYISSQSGIYRATCHRRNKYPVSSRPEKKWDAPVLALSASYGCLAMAAGDEGLFEMDLNSSVSHFHESEVKNISPDNCADCNWTFYSIYGSSHVNPGFLAAYEKIHEEQDGPGYYERKFKSLIPESTIFQGTGYSWGVQDKLCQSRNGSVHIVSYHPWEDEDNQLKKIGILDLEPWKGEVVSGGIASFGVIIECENALVILPSNGQPITYSGEPVNWRVFPRSKHYENQLHIIYDDRIEIISFNHDYFVDQKTKRAGIEVFRFHRGKIEDIRLESS